MRDPLLFTRCVLDPDAYLPCWPNQPGIVIFMTKGLSRMLSLYLLYVAPIVFLIMFAVKGPLNRALNLIGFTDDTVSHFAFLREQYYRLIEDGMRKDISIIDYHVLEITILISIAVWGGRFLCGLLFLRQYDKLYLEILKYSHPDMLFGWLAGLMIIAVPLTFPGSMTTKGTLVSAVLRNSPSAILWAMMATCYFWSFCIIAKSCLFFAWKLFRQYAPWANLWHNETLEKRS